MDARRERIRFRRSWVWPAILASVVGVVVAAGAVAALETDTVTSYWSGLWWSISLITTVGFIGPPPSTDAGAALSVILMVVGFLLLAMVGAAFAALFVSEEEEPREIRQESADAAILAALAQLEARIAGIEAALGARASDPAARREPS